MPENRWDLIQAFKG